MIKFLYRGQVYETPNLAKKLKRMKLSLEDVEVLPEEIVKEVPVEEEMMSDVIEYFYYYNPETKESIISIYDKEFPGYIKVTKDFMNYGS